MKNIKLLFINRFKTFLLLSASMMFSLILLMIRMKLTHSFFFLFLVWNLFLAVIPFAISAYLVSLPKLNKFVFAFWQGVWLLFLPNSPYIVTDIIHLKISETHFWWLDILVILAFALNGLVLFYISLLDVLQLLSSFIKTKFINLFAITILFVSSFGVYLGRFLRYNSWEILSQPKLLLTDIINIIMEPLIHNEAWLFTILFGSFLTIGFWLFKGFFNTEIDVY